MTEDEPAERRSREPMPRSSQFLLPAASVGALTGLGVAGFEAVVARGLTAWPTCRCG